LPSPSEEPTPTPTATPPSEASKVILSTSAYEIAADGNTAIAYFYAELDKPSSDVKLYDVSGAFLTVLKDDGLYQESGDDLPNDNIYSGKLPLSSTTSMTLGYYAVAVGSDVQPAKSENLTIRFIPPLTEAQLNNIKAVDTAIEDVFLLEGYDEMPVAERTAEAEKIVNSVADDGLVVKNSITYDEINGLISFEYESGVLGGVLLADFDENSNGPSLSQSFAKSLPGLISSATPESTGSIGEAIVLWSFSLPEDNPDERKPFYNDLKSELDANGLQTTIKWGATVEDFKKLSGYEVIMISGHGVYYPYRITPSGPVYAPLLILDEIADTKKNTLYDLDLQARRIGKLTVQGNAYYAILPEMFKSSHVFGQKLDGAFVYIENCETMGNDQTVATDMPDALITAKAGAIVAFHSDVSMRYSRELMKTYLNGLLEGKTAKQAFDSATATHGKTDGSSAYPVFSGDSNAVLVGALENGSFEESSAPVKWNTVGDVRVIPQLGELKPQDGSKMGIISTGIGSAEDEYGKGTEGSILYQSFNVPANAKTLTFNYNVVSEEPTEWIGKGYNDTFEAELAHGGNTALIAKETIDASTWYRIYGIDFNRGDSTTYHTRWKTATFNLAPYAGKHVTLRFHVYDVLDSIYDTAVLVDSINIR
jgi:hypothetical protein